MNEAPEAAALERGRTGWVVLAGLGVAYVIGGDFSAWNFGLAVAGWGGMIVAVGIALVMWLALMLVLAELSTIAPTAGGGYGFAEAAFGRRMGQLTGAAILIEYVAAAAVVAIFVEAYFRSLTGIGGWPILLLSLVIPLSIHMRGGQEALAVVFGLTLISIAGILCFGARLAGDFDVAHLADLPVTTAFGASRWLPHGWLGVWTAMPFATAFFLAVEGIAMAAEEVRDPAVTLPRAMICAVAVLLALALILLFAGPGAAGVARLVDANDPLPRALALAGHGGSVIGKVVTIAGLVGLGACLFSAIFAFSRQAYALARAGFLPTPFTRMNRRGAPITALMVPTGVAFLVALTGQADGVFVMMVAAAMASYVPMALAHVRLRARRPDLVRAFRTPGGAATAWFAAVMSAILLGACVVAQPGWSLAAGVTLAVLVAAGGRSRA